MKLKKFDYKLHYEKAEKKKRILVILSAVVICVLITLASSYAYYQSIELQNPYNTEVGEFDPNQVMLAITVEGSPVDYYPSKSSGYVGKVTCDKGAKGSWDVDSWSIKVLNVTETKTVCNIDFIEASNLNEAILAQYGGAASITTASAGTFSAISTESTNVMYKIEDDYGTSYYYRGAKVLLNNNIIFAGYQWKIVRINGNESTKIIYNGSCSNNNCTINDTGTATQIKMGKYGDKSNDAKYVGYMYGGEVGVSSTSRAQAVTNEASNSAKKELETWYIANIENKGYSDYISDTLFCNDRRLRNEVGGTSTGPGYGSTTTLYAAYYRLYTNKIPTLLCGNKNDKFTVNDVIVGNGDLSKPVGLITGDEISLAGAINASYNLTFYLNTDQNWWSMTPNREGNMWTMRTGGYYDGVGILLDPTNSVGFRPVINLNLGTMVTGSGSATDPFVVI